MLLMPVWVRKTNGRLESPSGIVSLDGMWPNRINCETLEEIFSTNAASAAVYASTPGGETNMPVSPFERGPIITRRLMMG
jgi:hypothetical protein